MGTLSRNVLVALALIIPVVPLQAGEQQPIPWGYEGDHGPFHWGELGSEFALCDKGMSQSPIDLLRSHKIPLTDIQFSYKHAPFHVINNGHTLEEIEPISEKVKSRYPKHGQTVLYLIGTAPSCSTATSISSSNFISIPRANTRSIRGTTRWNSIWCITTSGTKRQWWPCLWKRASTIRSSRRS
ncbi:MAG: hypothetical protein HC801_03945 [Nitrospira sp.]|nr:hypothetical protein [Nitrospira sp.]